MNKRNYFLDFFKFIGAVGVILVHIRFTGYHGKILASVGTWGVGLIAVISGYACYGDKKVMPDKIIRRFLRNGLITVVTVLLYVIFSYFELSYNNQLYYWDIGFAEADTYIKMLIFGDFCFFYASALWYMVALLYCYMIFYFLVRYAHRAVFYVLLPVTVILRMVTVIYVTYTNASWNLTSNFLVGVLPMMLIGYVFAEQKENLVKFSTPFLITGSVISL